MGVLYLGTDQLMLLSEPRELPRSHRDVAPAEGDML
jgi:hypothetical protein